MGTRSVNMVDAVATMVPRLARARSAVLRIGTISGTAAAGLVEVEVGAGTIVAGYHTTYVPAIGDVVSLINDRDIWLVIGPLAS